MKKPLFTGSGVALVTPFTKEGVDYDKLGELIEFHIANSTDAIIICGTTGEASTMPDAEHKEAIRYTVEKTAGRIPVIAGTGSNDTPHAIELSKYAQEAGCDGILVVTPYYNKTTQKGLYLHFKAIADSVDIPIILYNVPGRTKLSIALDTLEKLAKIDNIVAIKEASGDIAYLSHVAARVPELAIYSGNDDMVIPTLSVGGLGVISVAANIIPKDMHEMCQLYFDGKGKEAAQMQLRALDLIDKLFIEVNPIPIKNAMNMLGFAVGDLRMPLCDLEEKNVPVVKQALLDYGLKVK
ncbi:MAG TPA: 4-hydroxy-tetrahydrodipicolinate synthase [Candidatus Aphodoplasma excrementigallinarum]|uniref:4-hydroxy-tetrahydrodipicolinate synthase n=1 Tax=Candidatus Aphodoplasma excrementigallinarum TaxID=2840673 RepID=A0A9D1SZ20_9FIRM|nr:4-hydroxy-tetrahydrodipicolinate synthase [Candidatus Aphodoplasma excrementigallinarum]